MSTHPTHQDLRIATAPGELFVRRWPAQGRHTVPIVLFHDSLGCVELWRDFPQRLAAASGRQVIAYDRLGFGRSTAHPGELPASFIVDEAEQFFPALCAALGIERFIAFGHSVGGAMAATCAARHGQRCQALISESAQAFNEELTRHGIRQARAAFADAGQFQRLCRYHGDKAAWVLAAWTETWLSPAFADWRLEDQFDGIACPLLAIHGAADEYGSLANPRRIAGLTSAHSEMLILEDCAHVPHRERQQEVLDAVVRFLDGLAD